eukprot:CAMPEP_0181383004 /NCGR_PEP_ID=MMETSP1106-20121128/21094_1 /TAXON_ID=81844 /ORGANISM="Mantoniella antarctica, Strain SL-175" /LENGTH=211 /DNA_ID=CAMNT_0023502567 /DNA_START=249 /DNA_END=880 /DNA_ORIENTATION=+
MTAGTAPPPGFEVPIIDLSRPCDDHELVAQVRDACQRVGFFHVVNHGVPGEVLHSAMRVTRSFFELPEAVKMRVANSKKGFIPINGQPENAVRPTALHEKFSCSRVDGVDKRTDRAYYDPTGPNAEQAALYFGEANQWPDRPIDFEPTWTAYYKSMELLTGKLMTIFAHALGVPADFFKMFHDKHVTNLVALRYPPMTAEARAAAAGEAEA